jgi:hypothetical protein
MTASWFRTSDWGVSGHRTSRTLARTDVSLFVQGLHVTVVNTVTGATGATGEILRDLIGDPRKDHQPTGRPPGPTKT